MTLEGGNAVKGTGLAGAIGRARRKAYPDRYIPKNDPLVNPESAAIVDYLVGNGLDDKKVKIDSSDMYPDYLSSKLTPGDNVEIEVVDISGVSKVQISANGGGEPGLAIHLADISNPHSVTKSQVGLGNVANVNTTNADNINDGSTNAIITLTQESHFETAYSHSQVTTGNPHSVTKTEIGLSNVTNDAQLKRAAGDIGTFTLKGTPVSGDKLLIEDSEDSGNKKSIIIGSLPGGGVSRSGATNDHRLVRWNGDSADSIQNSTVSCGDTGILSAQSLNFGSASDTASYGTGTITVDWSTCKPIQNVSITGNVTTVSMTAPSGISRLKLLVTASGNSYSITGFSGVYWTGRFNPDSLPLVIKKNYIAVIDLEYNGTFYVGKLSVIPTEDTTPTIVGTGTPYASASSDTFSFTYPSGVHGGDIAVVVFATSISKTLSSYPSGYAYQILNSGVNLYPQIVMKALDGTETGSTGNFSYTTATKVTALFFVVRGPFVIPYSSIWDESVFVKVNEHYGSVDSYYLPSILNISKNSMVIGVSFVYYTSAVTITKPSEFTDITSGGDIYPDIYISAFYKNFSLANFSNNYQVSNSIAATTVGSCFCISNIND